MRITGFSCAFDHVFTHFVTVIAAFVSFPVFSRDDSACSRCGSGVLY